MRTTLTLSLALFISFLCYGQTFSWVDQFGGSLEERSNSIATDAAGNVYTTGQFQGTIDFDPGAGIYNLTSAGDYDIFISKVNAAGGFIWAKRIGGALRNEGNAIAAGSSGHVYVTGLFSDTTDFDPGPGVFNLITVPYHFSCPPHADVFILKLTTDGDFVWAKHFGGDGFDKSAGIALGTDESIHLCGEVASNQGAPVDYDPGPETYLLSSYIGAAAFVLKLDSDGNFLWVDQWSDSGCLSSSPCGFRSGSFHPVAMAIDGSNNVHVNGQFQCTIDFDPGEAEYELSGSNGYDAFILKLNSSGAFAWARQFAGDYSWGTDIAVDANGNVLTTGYFLNTIDFDPGPGLKKLKSSAGAYDIYISKLNSVGNYVWVVGLGANTNDLGKSIDVDQGGNVYTSGTFSSTVDFNPGTAKFNLKSAGLEDVFVCKLTSSGGFEWAVNLGGTGYDDCPSMDVTPSNDVLTTGTFQGTADFLPGTGTFNLTAIGGRDAFVHKMTQSGGALQNPVLTHSPIEFTSVFPNPTTGITNIHFDEFAPEAQLKLYDAVGRLLYNDTIRDAGETTLDFSERLPGIYFLLIQIGEQSSIHKISRADD